MAPYADYAADISMGVGHVNDFRFVTGLYSQDGGRDYPLFLYMERPGRRGTNPEKLHLLACSRVPAPVEAMVRLGAFVPRKGSAGPVQDPGRPTMMWQQAEAGAVMWQVEDRIFWQDGGHKPNLSHIVLVVAVLVATVVVVIVVVVVVI